MKRIIINFDHSKYVTDGASVIDLIVDLCYGLLPNTMGFNFKRWRRILEYLRGHKFATLNLYAYQEWLFYLSCLEVGSYSSFLNRRLIPRLKIHKNPLDRSFLEQHAFKLDADFKLCSFLDKYFIKDPIYLALLVAKDKTSRKQIDRLMPIFSSIIVELRAMYSLLDKQGEFQNICDKYLKFYQSYLKVLDFNLIKSMANSIRSDGRTSWVRTTNKKRKKLK